MRTVVAPALSSWPASPAGGSCSAGSASAPTSTSRRASSRACSPTCATTRRFAARNRALPPRHRRHARRRLHDPYAALLSGKDWERLQERTTGDYAGVGLQVDARNGWITVVTPMPGTPGRAGRHPAGRPARRGGGRVRRRTGRWSGGAGAAGRLGTVGRRRGPARRRRGADPVPAHPRADPSARGAAGHPARRRRRLLA